MEDALNSSNRGEGRRAICPSKQDSGVCCWDSFCGDNSPEIMSNHFFHAHIFVRKFEINK